MIVCKRRKTEKNKEEISILPTIKYYKKYIEDGRMNMHI